MLLFRSEETVARWCEAHEAPQRPIISLEQLWYLAVTWYGNRLTVSCAGRVRTRWSRYLHT